MLQAIREGRDINTEMAERAWGGQGNQAAYQAMAYALEFGQESPSRPEIEQAWARLRWDPSWHSYGVHSPVALQHAELYLSYHGYEITPAEKSLDKVSSRGRAKMVLFSQMYGGGPGAVVNLLYCDRATATEWVNQFHASMPEVKQYMRRIIDIATRTGYVHTAFGRRIDVNPDFAYKCVDYVVQGTAADMLKRTMVKTRQYFISTQRDARFILPIHDEALFEIRKSHVSLPLLRGIKRIMEDTEGRLSVPMIAECHRVSSRWDKVKKGIL
jgi:hypothetical protein